MVDVVSHALWAYALFHHQPDAYWYAAFTLLPDLLWAIPAIVGFFMSGMGIGQLRKMRWRLPHESDSKKPYFVFVKTAYHASHSWLVMAVLSAIVAAVFPAFALPFAVGVFLHLGLDLFVHKDSFAGQVPLYPLSNLKVGGFVHWSDRKFIAANYALLIIAYALIMSGYL
ncbi:MAG: hypothetical protein WCX64_03170 [Candidatus Micrarchaeia archaeon]|jgi:hypothetical protein